MGSDHNFYTGISENISEGGLFIATFDEFPIGTEVDLEITLEGQARVEVHGIVRWIRKPTPSQSNTIPGVGIEFISLTSTARNVIQQFIQTRAPLIVSN